MNSEPLSESMPSRGKGSACLMASNPDLSGADAVLAFAQEGSALHPGRMDIGHIPRVDKLALRRVSRVRNQIDLHIAGRTNIPGIGFDRDLVLKQCTRFGTAIDSFLQLALDRLSRRFDRDRSICAGLIAIPTSRDALVRP